jgi:hypothetical protein
MSSKKRVYIAGPMTGYPQWNFAAFDAAAADLRQRGYEVVNPVDLDRDVGFDPATSSPEDFDLVSAIRRDVEALVTCQLIALLPGHENSKGATAERHIAYWAGLDVVEYPSMAPIGTELPVDPWDVRNRSTSEKDEAYLARVTDEFVEDGKVFADEIRAAIKKELANSFTWYSNPAGQDPKPAPTLETDTEDILSIAYRITRGDRQNSYGPPDQDFRRTANMWTGLFGEMLKPGVKFEPFHVAQAMILIKLSRQLHQRKADNWVDIAGYARCGAICDEASKNAS